MHDGVVGRLDTLENTRAREEIGGFSHVDTTVDAARLETRATKRLACYIG
jgi:hypothetical protein